MTNFKIGDVVYDEVNFPNQKGTIKKIYKFAGIDYLLEVEWESCNKTTYSIDGAKLGCNLPTLSHTPYTIEFKGFSQERPKVLTDEQKVCIKGDGTMEYGKKIIEYLDSLGGVNASNVKGYTKELYYLINDIFNIGYTLSIPQGYKEISLKEVEHPEKFKHNSDKIEKPLSGAIPKKLHDDFVKAERIKALSEAIERYKEANKEPNKEWIEELNELMGVEPHKCKYCGILTTDSDENCYKAPINYVGKKIMFNYATCLIIRQDNMYITIYDKEYKTIRIDELHNYKIID